MENAYFYSSKVSNAVNCFRSRDTSNRLGIYVTENSTTFNSLTKTSNTQSIVGYNITWTNGGAYHYNATYNIYIYPVADVAAARVANGD